MDRTAGLNYVRQCGQRLEMRQAFGALRPVCTGCGRTHFVDPKVAVGLLIEAGRRRFRCAAAAGFRGEGKWSIPAGSWTAAEDPMRRRPARGAGGNRARTSNGGRGDVPGRRRWGGADMLIVYRGRVTRGGELRPGDDASEAGYFAADALPELAFVHHPPSSPVGRKSSNWPRG